MKQKLIIIESKKYFFFMLPSKGKVYDIKHLNGES